MSSITTEPVFKFVDYKQLLRSLLDRHAQESRGFVSHFTSSVGMNRTYLPQVMNGKAQLSEEQTLRIASFFGFKDLETRYFQTLVRLAKAATPDLKAHFDEERARLLEQSRELSGRIKTDSLKDERLAGVYYSHWSYAAIHVALNNPDLRSPGALGRELKLSEREVARVIDFLTEAGLVKVRKTGVVQEVLPMALHLPKDSPHILKHHVNWRLKALESLNHARATDVHYSSVVGIAEEDVPQLKELFLEAIAKIRRRVSGSNPEETLCAYTIDFFKV